MKYVLALSLILLPFSVSAEDQEDTTATLEASPNQRGPNDSGDTYTPKTGLFENTNPQDEVPQKKSDDPGRR